MSAAGGAGQLTTHVLDTTRGKPAAGVKVELWRLLEEEGVGPSRAFVGMAETNADGRLDAPLMCKEAMTTGCYELVFASGDYFAAQGGGDETCVFEQVAIRVRIRDADAHYHVPLLVAPGGYTTYRGS